MKNTFRYLVSILAGVIALAACQQEAAPLGSKISVDKTSIEVAGQNAEKQTLAVEADGDWVVVTPSWIIANPSYGTGDATVELSFKDNLENGKEELAAARTAKVYFSVAEAQAVVEVSQEGDPDKAPAEVTVVTCEEFNAKADGEGPFRLTGTIVNVEAVSASYKNANFTIADESGKVSLYRVGPGSDEFGDDLKIENYGLAVGDIVTVEGMVGSYNGSKQMVQGVIMDHVKSLLSVNAEPVNLTKEAGNFTLKVAVINDEEAKANTLYNAPEVDVDWLVFDGWTMDGKKVLAQFSYEAYDVKAAPRTATITFSAGNGVQSFSTVIEVTQKGDIPDPVAIEAAVANEKGAWVSVKGLVMAKNKKGYILMDEAGKSIYAHVNAEPEVKIGDEVQLTGNLDAFRNFWQIANPISIILSSGKKITYPEPVVVDSAADIDPTAEGTHLPFYFEVTGVPVGDYGNVTVVEDYIVSPYMPISIDMANYIGKNVKLCGYAYQNKDGKMLYALLVSADEVAAQE